MKNLKVSLKLIIGFVVVIVLSVTVGLIGILGMSKINTADNALYNENYLPSVLAGNISQSVVTERVYLRNFVIYDSVKDSDQFNSAVSGMDAEKKKMDDYLAEYKEEIATDEDQKIYDDFMDVYKNQWLPIMNNIQELGTANDMVETKVALVNASKVAAILDDLTSKLQELNMTHGQTAVDSNHKLFKNMTTLSICVLILTVVVSMFLAFHISNLISKPANFMKDVLARIGLKGDLDFSDTEYRQIEEYAAVKDEIGQSVDMMLTMVRRLAKVGDNLETVAAGNLTSELALLSERDTMGIALQQMNDNLNNMFGEINGATTQVSSGAKQIADAAQSLAQGSTQQAAAVEELSSSIAEIAEQTRENAKMANKAADLSQTVRTNAEKGSGQMNEMIKAVQDINEASTQIQKVIKVIDDIAFQTNILALNAAVEAARAGQHGKGFAVVAEEVRNLAAKSASAAKDTGALIENSMEKAGFGSKIAEETATSLNEIVAGINESTNIVTEIAKSSEEQSLAITQINNGIDQVAQVVQQNSATSEESAATSEELSGQSNTLEELVGQFQLKGQSNRRIVAPTTTFSDTPKLSMPPKGSSDNFGKY